MARHREQLPRLNIPPSLNMQQPMGFDRGQAMFSPALPTSLQHSFHPPFPLNNQSMQTPMQPYFAPQPPPAPGRPSHHQGHASIAHLAAAGIHPPNGFPMTPLGGHFPRPSMMMGQGPPFVGQPSGQPFNGQPGGQPFPGRNRRQLSIGGPPKAALGGPGRKHSPLPPPVANMPATAAPQKIKKLTVNLPRETIPGENGEPATRVSWARTPLDSLFLYEEQQVQLADMTTAEPYPPDNWRYHVPGTIDVFLPGKRAWDAIKQQAIEEKLEKLGVERGSGSNVPHIHAPHARAASISSPADPALLFFKLNKLQQSQTTSSANSLSTSPQPPFNLSPSPSQLAPRFATNRHGHSMSLVQPPSQHLPIYSSTAALNPFGPNAVLGSDQIIQRVSPGFSPGPPVPPDGIHAPQGRVPVTITSLAPPLSAVRPDSRPDFVRGFGLDIPEEEEEPDEEPALREEEAEEEGEGLGETSFITNDCDAGQEDEMEEREVEQEEDREEGSVHKDGSTTAAQSRLHSRHVSRLSATLSLPSVDGLVDDVLNARTDMVAIRSPIPDVEEDTQEDMDLEDAVEEWTGSEDLYTSNDTSDDESIGEWSNPSDEERARQQRVDRRMLRRAAQEEIETPRRLPNFPRPPENTIALPIRRDDDIISNPSEDDHMPIEQQGEYLGIESGEYYQRPPSNLSARSPRPLPPLPHSRAPSGQFSHYDPAQAHSRAASGHEHLTYPSSSHHQREPSLSGRRDSLNPFAKPFIFGAPSGSGSWIPESSNGVPAPPLAPLLGHARLPSFGKPLNAAAQEFKPGGFNFRPPPGGPQLTLPVPESTRPLPVPPAGSTPFKRQGREKRPRHESNSSVEEEGDSMTSFKFPPNPESPESIRRASTPKVPHSRGHSSLNPSAEPFTFAGFSPAMPFVPTETIPLPHSLVPAEESPEHTLHDDSTAKAENGEAELGEFTLPSSSKPKRAPIPLDFKHPVSNNTVPAGLFKALVNSGDERTRRTVRSRLSSREIFEHSRRPSLDDLNVPPISRKISRNRLVTDPGDRDPFPDQDDVFGPDTTRHSRRRSSLPPALHSSEHSSISGVSIPAIDLAGRIEIHQYEQRLESLLDEKFSAIRRDLASKATNGAPSMNPSMEAMITEVVSLFRSQLQDSAARGLEDSQMDARGEMDFELIKDVIQQGHAESRALMQRELDDIVNRLGQVRAPEGVSHDMKPVIEQLTNRTINAVAGAISDLSTRLDSIERLVPHQERDVIVDGLMSALMPALSSLRAEAVDYDLLTNQLTQAVKPHISQLIDLASDKRETAELIVDKILPLLPSIQSPAPTFDTDAITLQLTTEVRRAIAPIDAFEIKEQVADLVVERLDSRLAVRDKAFNVDTVTGKVTEGVARLLEPIHHITTTLDNLVEGQETLAAQHGALSSDHKDIIGVVSSLSPKLMAAIEALNEAQAEIRLKLEVPAEDAQPDETITYIKSTVDDLASNQKTMVLRSDESLSLHKDVLERLNTLPEAFAAATTLLQRTHAEFVSSQDISKRELDELRKQNTDYQIQLAKARGAHGQVRVEKDVLSEKLGLLEGERDRLRSQVKEMQNDAITKTAEVASIEARNTELEEALSQALTRLQASDVATQTHHERIAELERSNRELVSEKQTLKTKVDSLDLQVTFASRDKDSALQSLAVLQKQHDHLASQQSHWDDLRHASEQIEMLTTLIGQADNEELKELRRIRDRSKTLEGEHAALQKRLKDQENKALNTERASLQARQSLAQAQQRASEWEKRAKEYEGQLELTRTKLDQAEQTQAQLDADYSLVKLQLEEREADDRLSKDRENKLRDQVTTLEAKVARLQVELEEAKTPTTAVPSPFRKITNGNTYAPPPRPDSRASTVYGDSRSVTPNRRIVSQSSSARSETPPGQASVWDSMHAPNSSVANSSIHAPAPVSRYPNLGPTTPKARRVLQYSRASAPSPTPSTVSAAPTQGSDGWWA